MKLLDASGLWMQRGSFKLGLIGIHVSEGECLILSGPNGSGKSTLLGGLCGFLPLMPGSNVDILGEKVQIDGRKKPSHRRAMPHVGVQIQGFRLFEDVTVEEHMRFFAGVYRADPEKYMTLASSSPALRNDLDKRYGALSDGMRQVLHFILAIGHSPKLLMLDEPTSGLDEKNQAWMLKRLKEFTSSGGGVVMSTHRSRDARTVGTSLIVLHDGKQLLWTDLAGYRNTVGYASRLHVSIPSNMSMDGAVEELKKLEGVVDATARDSGKILVLSTFGPGECSRKILALGDGWVVYEARETDLGDAFETHCTEGAL